jgi:hypothetical protein
MTRDLRDGFEISPSACRSSGAGSARAQGRVDYLDYATVADDPSSRDFAALCAIGEHGLFARRIAAS